VCSFHSAKEKGVKVDRVYVGSFMTSLEMAGVSITLLHLDETRTHCLGNVLPYFIKMIINFMCNPRIITSQNSWH